MSVVISRSWDDVSRLIVSQITRRKHYGQAKGGERDRLHWLNSNSGVETMAMPQRDDTIEAIKRLEPPSRVRYGAPSALLEYAVMHADEKEAERIREELRKLTESV